VISPSAGKIEQAPAGAKVDILPTFATRTETKPAAFFE